MTERRKSKKDLSHVSTVAKKPTEIPINRDPYTVKLHLSNVILKYDISAKNFDEAYKEAMERAKSVFEKYEEKPILEGLEIYKFNDLYF